MKLDDDRLPPTVRALLADVLAPPASDSRMARIARCERAYDAVADCLGESDPMLAVIAELLWCEYTALGSDEHAEIQLQRIVDVLDRPDAAPDFRLGMAFKHLAIMRMQQDRWDEVIPYCKRAIAAFVRAGRGDDLEVAKVQTMQGAVHAKEAEHAAAREVLDSCLPVLRQHADGRKDLINALRLLGQTARDQNEPASAYLYYVEAMGILSQTEEVTKEFFEVGIGSGRCLLELERYADAEQCMRALLNVLEESESADATILPQILDIMGEAQLEQEQYHEALATCERALRAGEDAYEPVSIDLAELYINLARARDEVEDASGAELAIRKAADIYERVSAAGSVPEARYVDALLELAERCLATDRFDEADELGQRLFDILHPIVGPSAPAIGQILGLRGRIRFARGAYDEALPLLEEALEILKEADMPAEHRLELEDMVREISESGT